MSSFRFDFRKLAEAGIIKSDSILLRITVNYLRHFRFDFFQNKNKIIVVIEYSSMEARQKQTGVMNYLDLLYIEPVEKTNIDMEILLFSVAHSFPKCVARKSILSSRLINSISNNKDRSIEQLKTCIESI